MLKQPTRKLWVSPPKYWAATERMTESEKENMMRQIVELAESGNIEALKAFDFFAGRTLLAPGKERRGRVVRTVIHGGYNSIGNSLYIHA
jgi:hypothetical protein